MYRPPFSVSAKAINLIADITALIERCAAQLKQHDKLRLRRINRVRTIRSSLAIEGNGLTESEVMDVLEGKPVAAPPREIQEVKNAIAAYELYPTLDAFKMDDMLKAHRVMMTALRDDAGHFRRGGVGVFSGSQAIHIAPPADRVYGLMQDLFTWLSTAEDHLLIRSCVFHYEFEFIHPFSDGNGRIGRLWQSLILGRLHSVFTHLPVENLVYANQDAYYDAIALSSSQGDSAPFIDFMLQEIYHALCKQANDVINGAINVSINGVINGDNVLKLLKKENRLSVQQMAEKLGVSARQISRIIADLKERQLLTREGSNKSGRWVVVKKTSRGSSRGK